MKLHAVATALFAAIGIGLSSFSIAYERGDWIWRVGLATMKPETAGEEFTAVAPGTQVDYTDEMRLAMQFDYMLTDSLALGVGMPLRPYSESLFLNDGTRASRVGTADILPVTVSAAWYLPKVGHWRTYLAAAWQYNHVLTDNSGGAGWPGVGNIEVDDASGVGGGLGLEYDRDGKWSWNVSVMKFSMKQSVKIYGGSQSETIDSAPDPMVMSFGMAKRF